MDKDVEALKIIKVENLTLQLEVSNYSLPFIKIKDLESNLKIRK
jgi:hypothetical protein